MAMIKCPSCGEVISETSQKCIYCGKVLQEEEVAVALENAYAEMNEKAKAVSSEMDKKAAAKPVYYARNEKSVLAKLKEEAKPYANAKYAKFMAKHGYRQSRAKIFLMWLWVALCIGMIGLGVYLGETRFPADSENEWRASSIFELCGDEFYWGILYYAMAILGAWALWVPCYGGLAHIYHNALGNHALIHYIEKQKIDLTEDIRKSLQNWKAEDKELLTAWIYAKKPLTFALTRVSFILGVAVVPLFVAIGATLIFVGLGHCVFATKAGLITAGVGLGMLVLSVGILAFSGLVKHITDRDIFYTLKCNFGEDYANSDATYHYGFVKPTKTVVTTKTEYVPVEGSDGKIVRKAVSTQEKQEVEIPGIKRKNTAVILCVILGLVGGHDFYNGDWFSGFLSIITLNFLGLGWIFDFLMIFFFFPAYYLPKKDK